jgi:surface carbohydrate biosynthesis protein
MTANLLPNSLDLNMIHPNQKRILIPVETYTREFDAKLLLACYVAQKNYPVVLGSRVDMHLRIAELPSRLYLAKDFRKPSLRIYRILKDMGVYIAALDEEGVVYPNRDFYYERRVNPETFSLIDHFFSWGDESGELLRNCPSYASQPISVTGSPRTDLLATRFSRFYEDETRELIQRYGRFFLINTNFGRINHFVSNQIINPKLQKRTGGEVFSEDQRQIWLHRTELFESFQKLVVRLAADFPDTTIIIRPHPSEDHRIWNQLAHGFDNVNVIHQGAVAPWLMAAASIIHNGCMTAIEAFMLKRPVFAFREIHNPDLDQKLPNHLSQSAYSYPELKRELEDVASSQKLHHSTDKQLELFHRYFKSHSTSCASEKIASHIIEILENTSQQPSFLGRKKAELRARVRRVEKELLSFRKNHKNSASYSNKRFTKQDARSIRKKLEKLKQIEPSFGLLRLRPLSDKLFEVFQDADTG